MLYVLLESCCGDGNSDGLNPYPCSTTREIISAKISFLAGKMSMISLLFRLMGMRTSWPSPQGSARSQPWSLPFPELLRAFLKYRIMRKVSTSSSRTATDHPGGNDCRWALIQLHFQSTKRAAPASGCGFPTPGRSPLAVFHFVWGRSPHHSKTESQKNLLGPKMYRAP